MRWIEMNQALSPWIEVPVALLLVLSGIFALSSALGLVRFKTFFQRMHPPALAFTFASWCVTLASIIYFSALEQRVSLHAWLIVIFLSLTVPVTTVLLSRTELFRKRTSGRGDEVPPPVGQQPAPPTPQTLPQSDASPPAA